MNKTLFHIIKHSRSMTREWEVHSLEINNKQTKIKNYVT